MGYERRLPRKRRDWNVIAEPALGVVPFLELAMKTLVAISVITLVLTTVATADAKGCLKGAVVGGIAGHYAGHHGVLGAAAGCAYGRHDANKRARLLNNPDRNRALPDGQERL